jgi:hypothetical protein
MNFRTTIDLNGKTATGMVVPPEVVASLGPGKRQAVCVTINGYTYRSTVAPYNGAYMLPVSAEVRQNSGVKAGDEVEVSIEPDTEPRQVSMPADFTEALKLDENARRFFDGLSYSNQKRIVLSIEEAKTPETRQRRIDKAMQALREGRAA